MDEDYNWKDVAHHNNTVDNYVKKIASAISQIDQNRYPLDYYMSHAWDGLRETGYTAKKLNDEKDK